MKLSVKCDWCGKPFYKAETRITTHNFCCRKCLADFSSRKKNPTGYMVLKDYRNISAHCSEMNQELNPTRMTDSTRKKIREAKLNSGRGKTYVKRYGKHEHRIVAEHILGRALLPGEVVHHRDGNKRNNDPRNIVIFRNQSEHAKHHADLRWFLNELEKINTEGGDAL